jgi:DNA-binding transcriptional MerR regulator
MEYRIGDFSLITRLTIKTLRFYQAEGILEPDRVDAISGYRYYDEKSVERAVLIRELRTFGFSVKDIREIVASCGEDEEILPYLERKRQELRRAIDQYKTIDTRLARVIEAGKERIKMNEQDISEGVTLLELGESLIVSTRYRGKYSDVGKHIGELFRVGGGKVGGPPFSLYHEAGYSEDAADIELCLPLKAEARVMLTGVTQRRLPGGRFARALHHGSYQRIGETYRHIFDYLQANALGAGLPSREIYLKGPGMLFRGNPQKYLTEILVPIAD